MATVALGLLSGCGQVAMGYSINLAATIGVGIPIRALFAKIFTQDGLPEIAFPLGSSLAALPIINSGMILKTIAAKIGYVFFLNHLVFLVSKKMSSRAGSPPPKKPSLVALIAVITIVTFSLILPLLNFPIGLLTPGLLTGLVASFGLGGMKVPYAAEVLFAIGPSQGIGICGFLLSLGRFIALGMMCSYYCWKSASKVEKYQKERYMRAETQYTTEKDLAFLRNRLFYIKSLDAIKEASRVMRIYLKGIVPIMGLVWVVRTETGLKDTLFTAEMLTNPPQGLERDESEQRMLFQHLSDLEIKLQRRALISPIINVPDPIADTINAYFYAT